MIRIKEIKRKILSVFIVIAMLAAWIPSSALTVFADVQGSFALMVLSSGGPVIAPEYVSYGEGETIREALMGSGHAFTGIESGGFITAVDGVADNYSIAYDGAGFDLDVNAGGITALYITANYEQTYSETLLALVKEMAAYNASTDGRKNDPGCNQAYAAALSGFYAADEGAAQALLSGLSEAEAAYEAYISSDTFTVALSFSKAGAAVIPADVTFTDEYGNVTSSQGAAGVELIPGNYSYLAWDGENGYVRGTVAVDAACTLTAEFVAGQWISDVQLGLASGWSEGAETERTVNSSYDVSYYVPDYAGTNLYPYITPGEGVDPSAIRVYKTDSTVARTWNSRATSLAKVIEQNSMAGTEIVLEARYSANPNPEYEQFQHFTMHIVRTPSLKGLTVASNGSGLPLVKADGSTGFVKEQKEYSVVSVSDTLTVSAQALCEDCQISIAGQTLEDGQAAEVHLSDCQKEGDIYKIPVSVTASNGLSCQYMILASKVPSGCVKVSHSADESVTVKDTAGNEILPAKDANGIAEFEIATGNTYTLVTTKAEYYHAKKTFVASDQLTMTAPTPKTVPWLTAMDARAASSNAKSAYSQTPEFSGSIHEYVYSVGSTDTTFYLKAAPEDLNLYTTTIYWTNQSTGAQSSTAVTSKTAYKVLSSFVTAAGTGSDFRVEVVQKAEENGVTYYQEYLGHASRCIQLAGLSVSDEAGSPILLQQTGSETTGFTKTVLDYQVLVPSATASLNLAMTATAKDAADTGFVFQVGDTSVTYEAGESTSTAKTLNLPLDVNASEETIEILAGHTDGSAISQTYTITVKKLPPVATRFTVLPEAADETIFLLKDLDQMRVFPEEDGTYSLNATMSYTLTVTAPGFKGQQLTFVAGEDTKNQTITLEKAQETTLPDISEEGDWTSFRGNDDNNGVIEAATPVNADETYLLWASKVGSGYGSGATGCPILVGDMLYTYAGTSILKIDKNNGNVVASGTMVANSSFAINTPTYAAGMIFVGLSNGRIQAFNAETLESLWVYQDALGGQPNCQITYKNGYIYTGFWNSETKAANFVCVNITDEDPSQPTEAKLPVWTYTDKGFYWAGAYACDDYVLVTTDDGEAGYTTGHSDIVSLDPKTGAVIDKLTLPGVGDARSSICYDSLTDAYYFTTKGGDFYQVKTDSQGAFLENSLRCISLSNGSDNASTPASSTCTPVIYKGRAYIGVMGTSQFTPYTGHNLSVIDLDTFSIAYSVPTMGYPQTSGLLTTAYEGDTEYVYVYFFDNYTPGKLRVIRDHRGLTEVDHSYTTMESYTKSGVTTEYETGYVLFTPSGSQAQYAICSPIADKDGNIYFKNDSAQLMCLSSAITSLEITSSPEKTVYHPGMVFDGTGLAVTAHYANGMTRDISSYLSYTDEPLTEDDSEITIRFDLDKTLAEGQTGNWTMYQDKDGEAGQTYYIPSATVTIDLTADHVDEDADGFCDICHETMAQDTLVITKQPETISAGVKTNIEFSVEAENAASYQWYYTKNGSKWYPCTSASAKTSVLEIKVSTSNASSLYKCTVTGTDGSQIDSDSAGINLVPGAVIKKNPVYVGGALGETVSFSVTAEAAEAYQWYYSKNGETWYKSGAAGSTTDSISFKLTSSSAGNLYQCRVTGPDGNAVRSNNAGIILIDKQPQTSTAAVGQQAVFSVKADGIESYQWYYSKNGENWYISSASGNTTDTLTFTATASNRANIYRCKLTRADGISVFTNAVGFTEGLTILTQPSDCTASEGDAVYFTVTAKNVAEGGYQWYYSKDGVKWLKSTASGNTTDTLTLTAGGSVSNNVYRCKLTGTDGSVLYTNSVKIVIG